MTEKKNNKFILLHVGILLAIFAWYLLFFHLVLKSALSADDMWNSNIWTAPYTDHPNAWMICKEEFVKWLHLGRFFPVSTFIGPYVFALCPSVLRYKLFLIIMTYVSNLACAMCIRKFTGRKTWVYLYLLIFPVLIQLTPEFDSGFYCFHSLIQTTTLFCFLGLFFVMMSGEKGKLWPAIVGAVCYLVALNTYEVAFVFMPIYVVAVWMMLVREGKKIDAPEMIAENVSRKQSDVSSTETTDASSEATESSMTTNTAGSPEKRGIISWIGLLFSRKSLIAIIPSLAVWLVMGGVNVYARKVCQTGSYGGTSISLRPGVILLTLAKQCSTCIPLGRRTIDSIRHIMHGDIYPTFAVEILHQSTLLQWVIALLFLGGFLFFVYNIAKEKEDYKYIYGFLAVVGAMVWILPGSLIAISSKYQEILGWCSGHLPAYMQSLGFCMLTIGVVGLLLRLVKPIRGKQIALLILGGIAVIVILLNQISAAGTVEYRNTFRKYPQENITYAAKAGLFDEYNEDMSKVIVGTTGYIYDNSATRQFYDKFTGMNLNAVVRDDFVANLWEMTGEQGLILDAEDFSDENLTYYGCFNMANREDGAVILGPISQVEFNKDGEMLHLWIEDPQVFIRGDGINYSGIDSSETSEWVSITTTNTGTIYQLEGEYDILQDPEYYETENGAGRLYR